METLTPQQRAAVENRGGSLLVSAAAGSGKTKVLVERLFRYVTEEHRNLDDFLIITYTNAAAAELRSKIAGELSRRMGEAPGDLHLRRQLLRVYQADIKTVDAFCNALLRENTHLLAEEDGRSLTPDFRVLDEDEAALLRERVLRRLMEEFYADLSPGRELLADTLGAGRDDSALAALVLEIHGKLQSHAYPLRWLERSRESWSHLGDSFDGTPYAAELLAVVRRKAEHVTALLRRGAEAAREDDAIFKGIGEKFLTAADSLAPLCAAHTWEQARTAAAQVMFPRLYTPKGRKDDPLVVSLKQVWDTVKSVCADGLDLLSVSGEEAMGDLAAMAPAMDALLELTGQFAERYRLEKLRVNAADFSDQEHLALRLLTDENGVPTELGAQISGRYAEILVDEYQDCNEVQNAIFRAVSRQGNNLFTVGDVKQSIYRFRLAEPGIFLDKYRRFVPWEEAEEGQERKLLLSRNFRSRREILDAANFVFSNILSPDMGEMEYGPDEALYFGAAYYPPRRDCETEFHLIAARRGDEEEDSDDDDSAEERRPVKRLAAEARFVAKRVRELLDTGFPVTDSDGTLRPCRPEDIVILMRSPGSRTAAYYQALAEQNVPCAFEEGGGFFETMEVSTVLSLLQVVDNPRQDVPLISVLRSPLFGFTPDRLAEIRGAGADGDFYDAVKAAAEDDGEDCAAFLVELSQARQAARDMDVCQLLWYLYNRLHIPGVFGAMDRGAERTENLMVLSRQAEQFERSGYRGLFAFVTQLRRLLEADRAPEGQRGSGGGGVRLMSVHRSKGLEFPIVILADLNHAFSRQDFNTPVLVHPELGLGPQCVDLQRRIRFPTLARLAAEEKLRRENLAEEQRILYVAMTRPKEKLILVDSLYYAQTRLQKLAAVGGRPVLPETVAEGKSFGDWLLLTLLDRPEAEVLRRYAETGAFPETAAEADAPPDDDTQAGPPDTDTADTTPEKGETAPPDGPPWGQHPWRVFLHDSEWFREVPRIREETPSEQADALPFDPSLLPYAYPYEVETTVPAKVTATQLKGRAVDEEIAEHAAHTPYLRPLSQPKFRWPSHGLTPAERGTATHLVLQYLDFDDRDAAGQIAALAERDLLTAEQAAAVDVSSLTRFLNSPLAEEIRRGQSVLREYRFTVLLDAAAYDPAAASGDKLLLQGVVDCCFETAAGVTVVDFKTDRVRSREELSERAERYRPQLEAYSLALSRALEKPVVRRVLYFLEPGAAVEV